MVYDDRDPDHGLVLDLYGDDVLCELHMGARPEEPGDCSDIVSIRGDGPASGNELAV